MRFVKRLVFIIILLLIAFFVYRLINPTAAKELLYDLKSFSNTTIGTHFSLSGETLAVTGTTIDMTGMLVEDTGSLSEITGDDELLLNDADVLQEDFGTGIDTTGSDETGTVASSGMIPPPIPPKTVTPPKTTTTSPKKTTPPSSNSTSDLDRFLQNFRN